MSLQRQVYSTYRNILRAAADAFRGDSYTHNAALQQIKNGFRTHELTEENLAIGRDVALILKHNVVQGARKEDENLYHINIRKDTELGDNEDVKKPNKRNTLLDGTTAKLVRKPCSEQ